MTEKNEEGLGPLATLALEGLVDLPLEDSGGVDLGLVAVALDLLELDAAQTAQAREWLRHWLSPEYRAEYAELIRPLSEAERAECGARVRRDVRENTIAALRGLFGTLAPREPREGEHDD